MHQHGHGDHEAHRLAGLKGDADGKAIQQALINLIDNALKHSLKGETVVAGLEVHVAKPEGQNPKAEGNPKSEIRSGGSQPATFSPLDTRPSALCLWVEDHGPGIPAEEHEKIFERFYRLGSELRRETPGVGIGLSIVKHIVEAHGGKVLVRSAVGQGSRFTVELPMINNEETKKQSSEL